MLQAAFYCEGRFTAETPSSQSSEYFLIEKLFYSAPSAVVRKNRMFEI